MTMIVWCEGFQIGYKDIDNFHSAVIELVNQLEEEIIAKSSLSKIKKTVVDIYKLARKGFTLEENIMFNSRFQELEERSVENQRFLLELDFFIQERLKISNEEVFFECYDFLYSWVFKHILEDDQRFAEHLKDYVALQDAS